MNKYPNDRTHPHCWLCIYRASTNESNGICNCQLWPIGLEEVSLLQIITSDEIALEDRDCIDRTPLMVAIESGEFTLVRSLLALGADPDSRSNDGETCLSRSIHGQNTKIVEALLHAGTDIEQIGTGFLTPLALSCVLGNVPMIKCLLHHGANLEARGEMDETPLIEAAFFGQQDAMICLLEQGADRSAKDAFGRDALTIAKERKHLDIIYALLNF